MKRIVVGDVHGEKDKLVQHLRDHRVIDRDANWIGSDCELWFLGDYFDRGPDGIGVVDLIMDLQRQASGSGGNVQAIVGNHEVLFLGAMLFGDSFQDYPFESVWRQNGGMESDLDRLEPRHSRWLRSLPALGLSSGTLFTHADTLDYDGLGRDVLAVNQRAAKVLESDDPLAWAQLMTTLSARYGFLKDPGRDWTIKYLGSLGAERVVHGHTPVFLMTGDRPFNVTAPYVYHDGVCINADSGMYLGPGFIVDLDSV